MIVDDVPFFVCTANQPTDYDPETRSFGRQVDGRTFLELPDALAEWERLMVDHAWHGAVCVWHATVDGRRQLVASSEIGRTVDDGLTAYGRALVRAIDAPPVAYRLLPDPAAVVHGEHPFIARRLGAGMEQMLRCALTIADDGSWQCAIQPVTMHGKPSGPAMVVNGTELDPAITALAILAGAAPLPDRPIGAEPN